ncbi:pilin [Patescibacteria group bacterium]|nr:pilin [Patescibacteria group bacterium]
MIKKIILILSIITICFTGNQIVFAQRGIDPSLKPTYAPDMPKTGVSSKAECEKEGGLWDANTQMCGGKAEYEAAPINAFLQILAGALLMLSGGLAVIVISVGGIMYITSHGEQQQLEYAKNTIVYGLAGSLVVIFSYLIVKVVIVKLLELG